MFARATFALAAAALTVSACGADPVVENVVEAGSSDTAPDSPGSTTCHYPTTVPGGTVPQPLCPDAVQQPSDDGEADGDTAPVRPVFTCPEAEDYPIVMVSTSWGGIGAEPSELPACQGGIWSSEDADGLLMVPTEPALGVPADTRIGVEIDRYPGGLIWNGYVGLPAVTRDERVLHLQSTRSAHPDAEAETAEQLDARCEGLDPVTIRGTDGCADAGLLLWADVDVIRTVTYSDEIGLDQAGLIDWLAGWRLL